MTCSAERQLADLVEEERAARGLLEKPLAVAVGVGEGALAMPEQLGLEQGVGDGAAVDGDEGPAVARREPVDGAGDQLLAGARLAVDEHRGLELGDLAHGAEEVEHLPAARHQVAEPAFGLLPAGANLLVQRLVLAEEALALLGLAQQQHQLVGLEGLRNVVVGAALHGLDGDVAAAVGGHDHDGGVHVAPPDLVDQVHAALPGHAQVRDDDVVGVGPRAPGARFPRRHPDGLVALPLEQGLQHMPQVLLVIDDEHTTHGCLGCQARPTDLRGSKPDLPS